MLSVVRPKYKNGRQSGGNYVILKNYIQKTGKLPKYIIWRNIHSSKRIKFSVNYRSTDDIFIIFLMKSHLNIWQCFPSINIFKEHHLILSNLCCALQFLKHQGGSYKIISFARWVSMTINTKAPFIISNDSP